MRLGNKKLLTQWGEELAVPPKLIAPECDHLSCADNEAIRDTILSVTI
jgi:hypothetical protein